MDDFNADLHIHSPHSIAVSKSLNLDTMVDTCKKKGLNILGTGDILQPGWFEYMKNNLEKKEAGEFPASSHRRRIHQTGQAVCRRGRRSHHPGRGAASD